jgi:tetratricopeptide (TPR) repeat protein
MSNTDLPILLACFEGPGMECYDCARSLNAMRVLITVLFLLTLTHISVSAQVETPKTSEAAQAATLFDQGQTAHEKGNLNSAVRLYTSAIQKDPALFQAYYQRAVALIALDQNSEAEADLKKTIELEPHFGRAHRALGRLLLDRGLTEEAKQEFERALEQEPKLEGVRVYYGSALIKLGQAAQAVEQLKAAIEQNEITPVVYALLGLAEERTGKPDDAFADYSRALQMNAREVIAREGRSRIYEGKGELPKAIEDAAVAFEVNPTPELALRLAALHFKAGEPKIALQIYRDQVALKPGNLALRADLIALMADNGEMEAAQHEIAALVKVESHNIRLLLLAGELFSKEQPEEAVGYYRAALEIEPGNSAALVQLATALERSKQYPEAISTAQKALAAQPDNVPAHSTLATSLFELKEYQPAAEQFLWIIQRKPQLSIAYYFFAISADKLGDCYDALKSYQEFARIADSEKNKEEIENAHIRISLLQPLAKHGKCKPASKEKK